MSNRNPLTVAGVVVVVAACSGARGAEVTPKQADPAPPIPTNNMVASGVAASQAPAGGAPSGASAPPAVSAPSAPGPQAAVTPAPAVPRCPTGMVWVAGGSFQRGGTKAPKPVPELCVDRLETTAAEYEACVTAGQCTDKGLECAAQSTYKKADKTDRPIVCVQYVQAVAYCSAKHKRLPTTDEWEWIARSGSAARRYVWGDAEPAEQPCWSGKHPERESCSVGSHPADATESGVLDMGGNVLEFTTTEQDATSAVRIARGGSWNHGSSELFRVAHLGGFGPDYRCGFLGIRCVEEAAR